MKKIIIILLAFLATIPSLDAQSILGIKVGTSYDDTLELLKSRFGKFSVKEDNGVLELYDFNMGDFHFDIGCIYFQWKGKESKLASAEFQHWNSVSKTASMKNERDRLATILSQKYDVSEFTNVQGFKCYDFFGESIDDITMLGKVCLCKDEGKDGKTRLYLVLFYTPLAPFIDETSDF